MSKSHSFRSDPWTTFSKSSDSLFYEDFIKSKLFILKTTHQTSRGIIKFKQMMQNKNEKLTLNEQIKFWLPFRDQGNSLQVHVKSNSLKMIYDHGLRQYGKNLINLYSSLQSQKDFNNIVAKFGTNILGISSNLDSRLRWVINQNDTQISSAHKFNYTAQKFIIDVCKVFNLHNQSIFYNSIRIIYKLKNNSQIIIKGQNNTLRGKQNIQLRNLDFYFTNFTFDYIQKLNDSTKIGIQTSFTKKHIENTSLAIRHNLNQNKSKFKFKVISNRTISLSYQNQLSNYGRWMVGYELSDIGRKNQSKVGLLVDLNF